ncbi:MAG: PKD domain-containing protein, partial [Clostridia bacterium]|nr:PKD domain-containing protein [Clostridia bacterium]
MKLWHVILSLLLLALLISPSFAVPITNSTVSWTNIYGTTISNISSAGEYDATSSEDNITNIQNRYIFADSLSSSVSPTKANQVTYGLAGLVYSGATISGYPQGSTSLISANDIIQGYYWDYGDGTTGYGPREVTHTHNYASPGTYTTNLTLSNDLDTTGITFSTTFTLYGPVITNISITPAAGGMSTEFTFNADVVNATSYQWQFSNNNISWNNISGATDTTWSGYPSSVGNKYIRLLATNSGFTTTSSITLVIIYNVPTATASLSPASGPLTAAIALSSTVTDPGPATTTYQWQRSSDNSSWTNIPGATTEDYNLSITFPSSGSQYFRLLATGTGGTGTSNVITYTGIAKPVFSSINANPAVGEIPFTTTLTAAASDTTSYQWQKLIGVVWTNIGTGPSITQSITTAGTIQIRVIATGQGGSTTSSTLTINSGGKPLVTINEPLANSVYKINSNVPLSAELIGADSFTWNFGDVEATGNVNANPTTANYSSFGT